MLSAGPGGMQIKVSIGGLPWPLSRCLAQALLPVAGLLALESVHTGSLLGARMRRDAAE